MRERFECAVLLAPQGAGGVPVWAQPAEPSGERLQLHAHVLADGAVPDADPASLIAAASLRLQRYDACLLPVEPGTLPWARMALLRARGVLRTPVLVLAHGVKAPALADLLALGVADFVRAPLCAEELRARLLRMAERRASLPQAAASYADLGAFPQDVRPGASVQESMPAYMRGGMAACAHAAPGAAAARVPRGHIGSMRLMAGEAAEPAAASMPAPAALGGVGPDAGFPEPSCGEPFRQAKARVVDGFERDYLRQALQRHRGNVAQAARASCKHRRAFWALMRKHRIEAAPYRQRTDT